MRDRIARRLDRLSATGLTMAAVALHQSMAPTLLVRDWYFQGVVSGIALVLGYGAGALAKRFVMGVAALVPPRDARGDGRSPHAASATARRRIHRSLLVAAPALAVTGVVDTIVKQQWTWDRLDHTPESATVLLFGTFAVTVAVVALLLGLRSVVHWVRARTTDLADVVLPRWIATALATVLVLYAVGFGLNTWVYQRTLDGLNETFTLSDGQIQDDLEPPTSTVRSAGPDSRVVWAEMGREGRRFVTSGPSTEQIAAVHPSGTTQSEPVRVFVGREQAEDAGERAALAVEEMERFGAFTREVVLVVVPTGTGWVNEQAVQPLEYLYGGDVATVSMQYSHLPSPLAFLTEAQAAQEAGEALISAVQERIEAMPEGERPTFAVSGESLGTFGASAAFNDLDDLLASTDASLWTGSPGSVHLRRQAEDERTADSLQIKPVWRGDRSVVFANRPSDVLEHQGEEVDAVFLQQADDAIVWWDWPIIWQQPDWLREPLDEAVNPDMRWYPVTTFLNLAVDMAVATAFDEEQGHMYGTQPALAWRAMLAPEGWSDDDFESLLATLRQIDRTI